MYSLALVAALSVLFAYSLTPLIRDWFVRRGWVDHPDGQRKVHCLPVPRAGGAIIAIAYLASCALLASLHSNGWVQFGLDFSIVHRVLPGAALIFIIGLLDDSKSLPPAVKLGTQFVACVVAFLAGVRVSVLHWPAAGAWWFSLPMTLFWLLLCTNAFNLIDGMDGLSSGLSLFAVLTLICSALLTHNLPLLLATVPLAGALLGFLPFNINPASVFLGDSGSYTIGFLLGCFAIVWSQKSVTLLGVTAPLMAFSVPLFDVALVVARRFLRQKSIFAADRLHLHHRLLERGLSPRGVVWVLYATACVGAALALLSTALNNIFAGFALLAFCGAACFAIKYLGYLEFDTASRIAFRGTFRQVLRSEMILHTTWTHLSRASTPAACWQVVRATASELGFCRAGMKLDDVEFLESFDTADAAPLWTITIPLDGRGQIELAHRFEQPATAVTLAPLTDVLHRCLVRGAGPQLQPRKNGARQPALSLRKAAGA